MTKTIFLMITALVLSTSAIAVDLDLQKQLIEIGKRDQQEREKMDEVAKQFGHESSQMKKLWDIQDKLDQENLAQLEKIIQQHGFPGNKLVGKEAATNAFLVIQHSPYKVQKKYLPMIREAVKRKDFSAQPLALLEDRILTNEDKPQIYGTQLKYQEDGTLTLFPIIDEANVDKRRAEIGLPPLAEYLKYFDMEYKPVTAEQKAPNKPIQH